MLSGLGWIFTSSSQCIVCSLTSSSYSGPPPLSKMSAAFKYSWRVGTVPSHRQRVASTGVQLGHALNLCPDQAQPVMATSTPVRQDFMPYFPYEYTTTPAWRSFTNKGPKKMKWSCWHGWTPVRKYHTHVGNMFTGRALLRQDGSVETVRYYSCECLLATNFPTGYSNYKFSRQSPQPHKGCPASAESHDGAGHDCLLAEKGGRSAVGGRSPLRD